MPAACGILEERKKATHSNYSNTPKQLARTVHPFPGVSLASIGMGPGETSAGQRGDAFTVYVASS